MSKLNDLCEACAADIGSTKVASPKGFDWSMIITLLLPILTEWLQGSCLAKQGAKNVETLIANGDIWTRIAMNQAVRRLRKEEGIKLEANQKKAVTDTLISKAKAGSLEPVLNEVNDAFSITSIWG